MRFHERTHHHFLIEGESTLVGFTEFTSLHEILLMKTLHRNKDPTWFAEGSQGLLLFTGIAVARGFPDVSIAFESSMLL